MGRPKRTIQRKPSGIYMALVWIDGKKYSKSLETKDELTATKRAAQAVRELHAKAAASEQSRWEADSPDQIGAIWDIPSLPDGSNDYANAKKREVMASEVVEPERIRPLEWQALLKEAIRVRKAKKGEPYSPGWHEGVERAIRLCPFQPKEATPALIRKWIEGMEAEGMGARYREIHCSYCRSLIKISIKSGLLPHDMVNPFSLVDFGTEQVKHIPPFLKPDYEALGKLLPTLPRSQRVAMLLQCFTGTRFSEIARRDAEDFDLAAGTFSIQHQPEKGKAVKNKHSIRVIPLPQVVLDELKDFDFRWPSIGVVNKKLKWVNPKLTSHSYRHGLIRLNRDIGGDADAMEVFTGHAMGGMKDTYGAGYGIDRLRKVVEPCWQQMTAWIADK